MGGGYPNKIVELFNQPARIVLKEVS